MVRSRLSVHLSLLGVSKWWNESEQWEEQGRLEEEKGKPGVWVSSINMNHQQNLQQSRRWWKSKVMLLHLCGIRPGTNRNIWDCIFTLNLYVCDICWINDSSTQQFYIWYDTSVLWPKFIQRDNRRATPLVAKSIFLILRCFKQSMRPLCDTAAEPGATCEIYRKTGLS